MLTCSGFENVAWTHAVGVSVSGNSLSKTAGDGWGNAGASSTKAILSGDGWAEITVSQMTYRMFGLNNGDGDQSYVDIDFAFFLRTDGTLEIYEKGTNRGAFGPYVAGDQLRVSVEAGLVRYRRNGILLYTSSDVPSYPLVVDTSLYTNGSSIT